MTTMPLRSLLTTRAHNAFAAAHDLADSLGHTEIAPAHLAIGVLREGQNPALAALSALHAPADVLEAELLAELPAAGPAAARSADRTWGAVDEALIDLARQESKELGVEFYGCEQLMLALLRDSERVASAVFARHGVTYELFRRAVVGIYSMRPADV